ncbi:hypothetical protein ACX80N_12520 [Arthrobacter sp. MDT2-16]
MAKKSRWRRLVSWITGKFGRTKGVDNSVDAGCRKLADAERELEGRIAGAGESGENVSDLQGELNTVRENMGILGC